MTSCRQKKSSLLIFALLVLLSSGSVAQSVLNAEYFFDTDPGLGSATPITLSPTGGDIVFTAAISTASLSSGFHQLAIRVKETGGLWSEFEGRGFYITSTTVNAADLSAAEYFFDSDPGNGNGTAVPITSGATANFTFSVPVTGLLPGFHFLTVRTKNLAGEWGVFEARGFYITASTSNAADIASAEYFFDADPGNGNGTPIAIAPGAIANFTVSLPSAGLLSGFHFLAIRTKGADGKWGVFESRGFYVTGSAVDAPDIISAEYLFDTDPGHGNGTSISILGGASSNFTISLPTTGLTPGFHFLVIRTKQADGKWGLFESRGLYISTLAANSPDIVAAEYFLDDIDPGEGNALSLVVNVPGTIVNQVFDINLSGVPSGSRKLNLRVQDANGIWSSIETAAFTVLSCTPPTAPSGVNASRCDAGSVILSATNASGNQQYHWYSDNITNTITFTGSSYSTPSLSTSTDYYVSIFDPSTGCESNRIKVSASVNGISKPTINPSGSLTLCSGNSLTISAPSGFKKYSWSNGDTTRQIKVSTSATYSVTVGDGTCTSIASDPFVLTVVSKPAKPIVQTPGGTTICGSGSITLSAPVGASSYLWSTGEVTNQISANTNGSYTVQITDSNNCLSDASDQITVQVVAVPSKPVITAIGSTALCNNSSVILSAPQGFTNYQWSTGATSTDIIVSTAGSYTVSVNNGNCTSVASDPSVVTVSAPPAKPIIQVTGSATICGSGSVTLSAPMGASKYIWSDNSTNQTLNVSTAGNYSVQIFDTNNCESVASDQIVVNVTTIPTKPSVTAIGSTSLCINSAVLLSAPSGFSTYQWSDGSIAQQVIAASAGNYSVKVGNSSNCLSASSDAVSVTVTNMPCNSGGGSTTNTPPSITDATIDVLSETKGIFDLKPLVTKGSAGIDFSTLRITVAPISGVKALIDDAYNLILDYTGISFSGKENIGIQVCDSLNSCTERTLVIDVVAFIEILNAVSPHLDGLNDFFNLKYIDKIDNTKSNKVTIVDRWGNEVFSISDYNNADRIFKGNDNSGKELPSGTYYYRIDFTSGRPTLSGFLSLKR
ncbi:MAG: gliding motility-associated C-terminal domain-containing protein [Bacteroidetes bacterium]|nr:gliding motility-associated C-terminal domain-containing protein [Bacteroidota bacterium]